MPDFYRPPAGVLFPFGHIVSDSAPPHIKHLYAVPSIVKFKSDVDYLCRQCRPLQIRELQQLPRRRQTESPVRCFMFSFDDGLREVYEVIAPILREKGLPAIFFLNSATVNNRRLMWRHKVSLLIERSNHQPGRFPPQLSDAPGTNLKAKLNALRLVDESLIDEMANFFELNFDDYLRSTRPYLTVDQILELSRAGFEFGAHSDSHPYFHEMPIRDQEKQIFASVHLIRSLGLPCRYFAFPFHDGGVQASVFRYMTQLNLVLSFGTSEARVDSIAFSFQRFGLDGQNANLSVRDILNRLSAKAFVRRVTGTQIIRRN